MHTTFEAPGQFFEVAGRKITMQFQVTAGNPPTLRVIAIIALN